jgi:hypothetical protein
LLYKEGMKRWILRRPVYSVGQSVKVERLEEEIPAEVVEVGDANLYLLIPLDGLPMFWAFESHILPLSLEEKRSMGFFKPLGSEKIIITHF